MKKILSIPLLGVLMLLFVAVSLPACEETEDGTAWWEVLLADLLEGEDVSTLFGWFQSDENLNQIESDINLAESSDLKSSVDLTPFFPPIGNQGAYGTCVAWAVGYNLRSFLNAKDGKYKPTSAAQQYSPKDLFWAISNSKKGASCNGTNFEPALDVLVSRGIAPLSEVPYSNLGDCSSSPQSSWTNVAADHKIESYRKINYDVNTVKSYLSQGRAVVIGARLGDNFMIWNSSTPISSDTYKNEGMQHAYHAMIVSGYNDSKNAFRVVNSWDTQWGDNGYIWVDYDFFVNSFCFAAFVGKNKATINPDDNNDNNVDPDQLVTGYDLLAWELMDFDDPDKEDATKRIIKYNVYNSGNKTINASNDWNIMYLCYPAYNAKDYEILLYDYYSDDYGNLGDDGSFEDVGAQEVGIADNWWNHINAPAGQSIAQALYGESDSRFRWGYYMPENITGEYYLVLIADGFDAIEEEDEENNYFFFTKPDNSPVYINKGVINYSSPMTKALVKPAPFADSPAKTPVTKDNVNTYKPEEIRQMLIQERKSGNLQKKVDAFLKKRRAENKTMSKE